MKVSFEDLIRRFKEAPELAEKQVGKAIAISTAEVQKTAKSKFGHYQPAIGEFEAWKKLTESTIKQKERGGGGEDPLIGHYPQRKRKGSGKGKSRSYPASLRNSILMKVQGLTGVVGTNNPIAEDHEFGTGHIPPRPFLRPALFQNQDFIKDELKKALMEVFFNL